MAVGALSKGLGIVLVFVGVILAVVTMAFYFGYYHGLRMPLWVTIMAVIAISLLILGGLFILVGCVLEHNRDHKKMLAGGKKMITSNGEMSGVVDGTVTKEYVIKTR